MQRLDSGETSACRPVPPHGENFRVFLILSCRVHSCRTQVPGNYGYRYPTSVCNESGNESIPGRGFEYFRDKSAETWLHRDCLNEFGLHTLPPGILKIPAKPWPGPATIPHVRLRVSSATASLRSGKIPIRILTRTVHIHPTRREASVNINIYFFFTFSSLFFTYFTYFLKSNHLLSQGTFATNKCPKKWISYHCKIG